MSTQETRTTRAQFHFDPACPLAWRTALWMREVRAVRPLEITWRFFSLEVINRKEGVTPDYTSRGWPALRALAMARRKQGNEGVERLYLTLGAARHGRREDIGQPDVLRAALRQADLDAALYDAAMEDETTIEDVLRDHQEAVRRYAAFGVPTIALDGLDVGFYGPIIHTVPRGEEAGEMWDYLSWTLRQPNLFELKRNREQATWGPVAG